MNRRWAKTLLIAGIATFVLTEPAMAKPLPHNEIKTETTDGIYGRFDGDLTFSFGPELLLSTVHGRTSLGAVGSISFYQLASIRVGFEQTLSPRAANLERALSTRLVLSPLFLLRFRDNTEGESAFFDLALDSLNVFVGPVFCEVPTANFGSNVQLDVGLGFGLPLFASSSGLWLRPLGFYRTGPGGDDAVFGFTLEYQFLANSGLLPAP